jgi:hypothetical protein
MDTGAFSEGVSRLYAEFADSIRDNDSGSVRNAYKQLRNSGRPIAEILNEAIRTVGVSHDELEKHLLGEYDSRPVNQSQDIQPSDLLRPAFQEPDSTLDTTATNFDNIPVHEPDATMFAAPSIEYSAEPAALHSDKQNSVFRIITEATSGGFYVRLAAWAFVVGMIGFVLVSVLQMLTVSSAGTSKLATTTKNFGGKLTDVVDMPAAQKDAAHRVFSPAPLNSITAVPLAIGSDLKSGGAVTTPRAPAKPDADTSAAQPPIQAKAEPIAEDASEGEASTKPITTPAAGPQRLTSSSDSAHRSVGVQDEVQPSEPPPSVATDAALDEPAARASSQTGMALNPPAIPLRGTPAKDTFLLLERGDSLFRIGDVTSARGFYERAAEKGNGQAALRLGESYDPSFLQQAHLRSVRADTSAAVLWYERARDLGVTEAQILLEHAKGE